jgi:hypothetical protein
VRRALLLLVTVLAAGCFGDGLTGSSTINGKYTLRTINGSPLPYTIAGAGTDKTEILDDAITLFQGGTYSESAHSLVTTNGQTSPVTRAETGSYTIFGTSVTLNGNSGGQTLTTISGNSMTIMQAGLTFVFSK